MQKDIHILWLHDPTLRIYPLEIKMVLHKDTYITIFITALFVVAKAWKWFECVSMRMWFNSGYHYHEKLHSIKTIN